MSSKVQLGADQQKVLAMGQVVYSDPDATLGYKTGVQFLHIDNSSIDVFSQLLQEPA